MGTQLSVLACGETVPARPRKGGGASSQRSCDECANGQPKRTRAQTKKSGWVHSTRVRVVGLCGLFVGVLVRVVFI